MYGWPARHAGHADVGRRARDVHNDVLGNRAVSDNFDSYPDFPKVDRARLHCSPSQINACGAAVLIAPELKATRKLTPTALIALTSHRIGHRP